MGKRFFLFLGILMDFLLAMRIGFFCMGRHRLKMIEISLAIGLEIDLMGRNQLKRLAYAALKIGPKHANGIQRPYQDYAKRL